MVKLLFRAGLCLLAPSAIADIRVVDDAGQELRLERPASRAIALSPHLTELVFAAGGGGALVAVSRHSDFPSEASRIPVIGDAHAVDRERLLALKPDLLLIWRGGMPAERRDALLELGIPVYQDDIRRADDVPRTLERLGRLLGTEEAAEATISRFRRQWTELGTKYRREEPVPVFYQIWHDPLYTVGRGHWLNDLMQVCGARNVFAELPFLAPPVSREAVLESRARVVALSDREAKGTDGWRPFPDFPPQKRQHFCHINPDWSERPGPRLVLGAEQLCSCLERLGY